MDARDSIRSKADWAQDTTRLKAFFRGARETPWVPSLILPLTFVGFGALTNETGLSWLDTILISVFMFALPGQVVLVDEMARGASIFTAAIAVTATSVRLLPLTVIIMPMIRDRGAPKWIEASVAYFVAVTMWVESMRRAPYVPRPLRSAYCLGISVWLVSVSALGALAGFLLASEVPAEMAAALLFMTPLYFLLGMLAAAKCVTDHAPIIFGLILGPVFHWFLPSFDLVLTGLTGGTAAFLLERALRRKRRGP